MPLLNSSGDAAPSEGTRHSSRIASNLTPTPPSRAKKPSPNKEKSDSGSTKKRAAKEQGGETLTKKKVCNRNVSPSGVCFCLHNIGPRLRRRRTQKMRIRLKAMGQGKEKAALCLVLISRSSKWEIICPISNSRTRMERT